MAPQLDAAIDVETALAAPLVLDDEVARRRPIRDVSGPSTDQLTTRRQHAGSTAGRSGNARSADRRKSLGTGLRLAGRDLDRRGARRRLGRAVLLHLEGRGLCAFLCWLTGSIGVCMGYHRQLTHGSFQHLPADPLVAGLAGRTVGRRLGPDVGGQPSQASRVQRPRRRSALAARRRAGGATCCGSCPTSAASITTTLIARFAPDLVKDPMMRFLHKFFLPSHVVLGGAAVRDRLLRLGLPTPAGRSWCGACSCGWSTCCT